MSGTLQKIPRRTAKEVILRAQLPDDALRYHQDSDTPAAFLERLISAKEFPKAARFLAYALPSREAIWWACQCARIAYGHEAPPAAANALVAAETWVVSPTENHRRAAFPAAEAAEMGTPAGCAALACFWSGGSLTPPNLPPVPPKEELTPDTVANAVNLAAVFGDPVNAPERFPRFMALGLDIAKGTNRWPEPPVSARTPGR